MSLPVSSSDSGLEETRTAPAEMFAEGPVVGSQSTASPRRRAAALWATAAAVIVLSGAGLWATQGADGVTPGDTTSISNSAKAPNVVPLPSAVTPVRFRTQVSPASDDNLGMEGPKTTDRALQARAEQNANPTHAQSRRGRAKKGAPDKGAEKRTAGGEVTLGATVADEVSVQ